MFQSSLTRLMNAVRNGDHGQLRKYLAKDVNPDIESGDYPFPGQTGSLLHAAAFFGHTKCVALLLGAGASLNLQSKPTGWTALLLACSEGHVDVVNLLIEAGVGINIPKANGATALYVAAYHGHLEITQLLLQHGAMCDQPKFNGATPLYVACQNGHSLVVAALLDHGASANRAGTGGATPLTVSCQEGQTAIVARLLGAKADANQVGAGGVSPLFLSSAQGHHAIASLLLENRAQVQFANATGETAMSIANSLGHTALVELMRKHLLHASIEEKSSPASPTQPIKDIAISLERTSVLPRRDSSSPKSLPRLVTGQTATGQAGSNSPGKASRKYQSLTPPYTPPIRSPASEVPIRSCSAQADCWARQRVVF
mmetsp:Transcript_43015/g.71490  ORF Transcript_43015/g.71490 Transcript_43015/m.71490 type:complete len:371 (+) Transcript_43015:164-1276(+)